MCITPFMCHCIITDGSQIHLYREVIMTVFSILLRLIKMINGSRWPCFEIKSRHTNIRRWSSNNQFFVIVIIIHTRGIVGWYKRCFWSTMSWLLQGDLEIPSGWFKFFNACVWISRKKKKWIFSSWKYIPQICLVAIQI